jgi:hypothetical protein
MVRRALHVIWVEVVIVYIGFHFFLVVVDFLFTVMQVNLTSFLKIPDM